jgi:anthranilate synthase component 2
VIVVVDHQDSFVYNLVQVVAAMNHQVLVVGSDHTAAELVEMSPDAVILSPGPGRPEHAGCFVELVRALPDATPVLGVCLGHQALATALGAKVVRAPLPIHGKTTPVLHQGQGIFAGLPSPLQAGRYHSLLVERSSLPEELVITAETEDGLIMGLQHRRLPRFGVQFHPESILTPDGPALVARFLDLVGVPV